MNAISRIDTATVRAAVLDTLTAAFADDAAVRRLYPDEADYRRHFPGFVEALGGGAFERGVIERGAVDHDADGLAAALWLPSGVWSREGAVVAHLEATIPPARLAAMAAGFEIQGGMHPVAPHWYLPFIGVRPEARGRGLGARLLSRGLARADAEGMPAYLEATNRRNAALYARHGFLPLGVVEAPGYPEIIAMWRPGTSEPHSS
jgi:GNAT superfamily N-acetyltransferase